MKNLRKYLFLCTFFLPLFLSAQYQKGDVVKWSADRKLAWKDYLAKPDPSNGAAAITSTYIGIQNSYTDKSFSYTISSGFIKNKSWVRVQDDHVLKHEQGHFDITEIYARKLFKALREYRFNRNTVEKDVDKIYDDVLKEKDEMQRQYDRETDFSRDKEKQREWLKKIDVMLNELKVYANYSS